MRTFIIAFLLLTFVLPCIAAEIVPVHESLQSNNRGVLWETVTAADTTGEVFWNGGCGILEVTGTQDTAEFELQWGSKTGVLQDIDSDVIPDGAAFNGTSGLGVARFNLAAGFAAINFTSAGSGSQDLDIRLIPYNGCQ